jgi:epoxide hydrolase-like predicted phosphatase
VWLSSLAGPSKSPSMASEPGGYRGLLVDWGGVLTTSPFDSFADFCTQEGLDQETVARALRGDPRCRELLIGLETGRLADEEFESHLAPILGVGPERLIARMFAASAPDPVMVTAVGAARAGGLRTGLVSNSWGTQRYDRALLEELFDAIVISGEVGVRKPAPQIYTLAAERIGVATQECVFVDDLSFNLDPAAQLGMRPVHHVRAQDTVTELERLLGVDLREPATPA